MGDPGQGGARPSRGPEEEEAERENNRTDKDEKPDEEISINDIEEIIVEEKFSSAGTVTASLTLVIAAAIFKMFF